MKKWTVSEDCSIYKVLDGFYNAYLVKYKQELYLVDTGRNNNCAALDRNIKKVIDGQIKGLILTHTHYDHCGNAAFIKEKYGAKVMVSSDEAEYLKAGSTPLPKGTNRFTKVMSRLGNKHATSWFLYAPTYPDIEIKKAYSINDSIKIIPTPGHSTGSLSVIIKNKYAIVGDVLFGTSWRSILPHFADNENLLLETWKELLKQTNCHTFLPGHGKPISRYCLEKEVNRRMRNDP